eukprot:GHVH01013298.1.p1 GENE.GHVH01013298.1~~GHVH01013298.1.p1  ORF type:complete len:225 (+),score=35.25 GHVH01013298.1:196-870(+)
MPTADELGLSTAEFEAALNLERMYSLVNKSSCSECGSTPVTHANTSNWKLLCNKCGKNNQPNAKKISITNFKSKEVEKFENKNMQVTRRKSPSESSQPPVQQRYRKKTNEKSKKGKHKRYVSSSSSSDGHDTQSTSSSTFIEKKSKKRNKPKKYSRSPARAAAAQPNVDDTLDRVNPPSAFIGANHPASGMNAIRQHEQQQVNALTLLILYSCNNREQQPLSSP